MLSLISDHMAYARLVSLESIMADLGHMARLRALYQAGGKLNQTQEIVFRVKLRKAYSALIANPNETTACAPFCSLLRACMFSREMPRSEAAARLVAPRPAREPAATPARVMHVPKMAQAELPLKKSAEELITMLKSGDAHQLIEELQLRKRLVGGSFSMNNRDEKRTRAVQRIAEEFIRLLIDKDEGRFAAYVESQSAEAKRLVRRAKGEGRTRLEARIGLLEQMGQGRISLASGRYDPGTREAITFIQNYLNSYQAQQFAEGEKPGASYKQRMEKFNAWLKANERTWVDAGEYRESFMEREGARVLCSNGIANAQILVAMAIYTALATDRPIRMPVPGGAPETIQPAPTITRPPSEEMLDRIKF